ncbi:MAG: 50S ribosomal protein L16 [Candidatus Nanohaloarchaeota archaeon QJJ-7]|nr:50S ribosomal protein L16 [Candidatus Nanohaloarchaeota archaeon QJJ-7]
MGLRPARIYRDKPGQPYTRMSQKAEDNYISGAPAPKISIFENGAKNRDFEDEKRVFLRVDDDCSIRGNALEAARVAANSHLRKEAGEENYHLKVKVYPHHVLRHHPLAGVAQADRYYEGMRKPFGRPTGRAALVDEGQEVIFVRISGEDKQIGRKALERAGKKIPVGYRVRME